MIPLGEGFSTASRMAGSRGLISSCERFRKTDPRLPRARPSSFFNPARTALKRTLRSTPSKERLSMPPRLLKRAKEKYRCCIPRGSFLRSDLCHKFEECCCRFHGGFTDGGESFGRFDSEPEVLRGEVFLQGVDRWCSPSPEGSQSLTCSVA